MDMAASKKQEATLRRQLERARRELMEAKQRETSAEEQAYGMGGGEKVAEASVGIVALFEGEERGAEECEDMELQKEKAAMQMSE